MDIKIKKKKKRNKLLYIFLMTKDKTDKRVHRLSCYSIKNLWVDHPDRLWCASRLFSMLCQPVGVD